MERSWLKSFFQPTHRRSHRRRIPVREPLAVSRRLELAIRRLGFEALERRLLLTVTSAFNPGSGLLSVSSDAADSIAIEVGGGMVLINNANPGSGPLAAAAVTQMSISTGPGGGTIDLSQLAGAALPNLQSGQIQGNGNTTLVAPLGQANAWTVTGANQGTLGVLSFQGVQNLTGGNQTDTFVYGASGSVSGTISEPAGGSVTLVGSTIALPGTLNTQGGSVSVQSPLPGFALNNSFTASGNIETQGGAVNVFLANPVGSGDSFTLSGGIYTQGGNVSVNADTIALNTQSGPATISTRDLAATPGNPASDPSVGNSGNISLTGISITLGSTSGLAASANLYAQVDSGSQYTVGTISLTASETAGAGNGSGFNFPVLPKVDITQTGITLNTAVVEGGAVTFTAIASSLHVTSAPPGAGARHAHSDGHRLSAELQHHRRTGGFHLAGGDQSWCRERDHGRQLHRHVHGHLGCRD